MFSVKRVPEFSLALLPGLLPSLATARLLKGSEVHAKLQQVAAANGLRIVTWWWMRGGFAAAREISGPQSVKGMRLQSCGLAQRVLAAAGADVADDPWGEIAMRLEMGALEGVAVPYEDFISLRLHEQAKFATFGGPSILTCFSPLLMSKRTWDRLTPEQQRAVDEAAEVADAYFETSQIEAEKRALAAFQRAGAKVRSITHQEYMAWLALAQRTAWADYVKVSPASRDLLNTAIRVILSHLGDQRGGDHLAVRVRGGGQVGAVGLGADAAARVLLLYEFGYCRAIATRRRSSGCDQVVVVVGADVDLHPGDLAVEVVAGRAVVGGCGRAGIGADVAGLVGGVGHGLGLLDAALARPPCRRSRA